MANQSGLGSVGTSKEDSNEEEVGKDFFANGSIVVMTVSE
jgi:hypothetical protein